jgi:hypothetical protein
MRALILVWPWRGPDLVIHPAGNKMWEIRSKSRKGRHWMYAELKDGHMVIMHHDSALEMCFRAIRDGLMVCSEPVERPRKALI